MFIPASVEAMGLIRGPFICVNDPGMMHIVCTFHARLRATPALNIHFPIFKNLQKSILNCVYIN